jgi:hypothetical protein
MAWVEQTGARSWRVRFTDSGGRVRSVSGFSTGEQARDYVADVAARRRRNVCLDAADGRTTLDAWTRTWLTTLHMSERTEENYRRDLRRHILPRWGDAPLSATTPMDGQHLDRAAARRRLRPGRRHDPATSCCPEC